MSVTPTAPPRPEAHVCAGLDWAKDDHAVCILQPDGDIVDRFAVEHTSPGLNKMIKRLLAAGVEEVGIERGDGPVVDALLAAGLVVLVISPNQVKHLRSRYGSAGNKDDRFDACVRILARAWADIIWRCWHDGVSYNPDQHNALQRVLNPPRTAA